MEHGPTYRNLKRVCNSNDDMTGAFLLTIIASLNDDIAVIVMLKDREDILYTTNSQAHDMCSIRAQERSKHTVFVQNKLISSLTRR